MTGPFTLLPTAAARRSRVLLLSTHAHRSVEVGACQIIHYNIIYL